MELVEVSFLDLIVSRLRARLMRSSVVHVRQRRVNNTRDLVDLIDRFIDGPLDYDLEWDDFISWKNENPNIECIRETLGRHEQLLFSGRLQDKTAYGNVLIEQRNKAGALLGIAPRERLPDIEILNKPMGQ